MKNHLSTLKNIISTYERQQNIFLSVLDENGLIMNANAFMVKSLQMCPPKTRKTSIFDIIHPVNIQEFRAALRSAEQSSNPSSTEVYVKNGYYHPMKWQINYLSGTGGKSNYFCVGHKIIDDERLNKFNRLGQTNYQLIMEGIDSAVLFHDRNGELIAVNQKTADMFGTTLERIYQIRDMARVWDVTIDICSEDNTKLFFADTPFMKALATAQPQSATLMIPGIDGTKKWYQFSSQPLFEANSGLPSSVVTNVTDLTHERILVQELNEKKALFNSFMNQTPNLAWVIDEQATLLSGNTAFFRYFRLDEQQVINRKITEVVPSLVAKALYERHVQVFNTGVPTETIEKVKWADGSELVFHINLFLINSSSGKKMLGGHAVNLADKYAAEKKLRETNDRLLLLTRATSDAIWEWDMQTGHIFRNDALMDMIGYHVGDQKGLSWWLRGIHPEDRNRVSDAVKESTDHNRQAWQEEYRFKCADGTYKHVRDKGYIVYENGLPVKMIGSLQDVSLLKDMENQLTEEKLRNQKEISETVIRVQEKERTRIGYELHDNVNQILSSVKLFVEMLTPGNKEEKKIKAKCLEYAGMAIEEIRKLSKELVVPKLNDKTLVHSIDSLIEDVHFSTNIRIKFIHDLETGLLGQGVQVTLFRIVQEQLKNIMKHSRAKKIDISLQIKNNSTISLVIRDNGVGFDSGKTRRGIGLSNIIERTRFYNGNTEIISAPGKGCTLSVEIPLMP